MNQAPSFEQLLAKSMQEMAQAAQRRDIDSLERLTRIARECKEGQTQEEKLLQLKESLATELDGGVRPESSGGRAAAPTASIRPVPPSAKAKGKQERNAWLRKLANEGVRLRQIRGVRYETESRKRVGIAYASEGKARPGNWFLGLPEEDFEFVVLLCELDSGRVLDFVLPPELVKPISGLLSRNGGQVKFHVAQSGVNYGLSIPGDDSQLITEYLGYHKNLR